MNAKRPLFQSRRLFAIIGIMVGLIIILGLVILSPFALAALASHERNWPQLSNIGQTYGAVAALLSSFALVGVVASLLYQARDSQAIHEQATRTFHQELLKMEMEDPALMTAKGAPWGLAIPAESEPIRQYLYIQMWISFLAGNYVIGESPDPAVRYIAENELFRSRAGRSYWERVGHIQLANSKGRRRRFFRILDEEYKKVVTANVPIAEAVRMSTPPASTQASMHEGQIRRLAVVAATAAAIGLMGGRFWRRSDTNQ